MCNHSRGSIFPLQGGTLFNFNTELSIVLQESRQKKKGGGGFWVRFNRTDHTVWPCIPPFFFFFKGRRNKELSQRLPPNTQKHFVLCYKRFSAETTRSNIISWWKTLLWQHRSPYNNSYDSPPGFSFHLSSLNLDFPCELDPYSIWTNFIR